MANGSSGVNAGHGGVHGGRGVMGQAAAMGTGTGTAAGAGHGHTPYSGSVGTHRRAGD